MSRTMGQTRATLVRSAATLRWGLRRHPVVLLVCIVALAVLFPLFAGSPPTYQAEANVVARQVKIDRAALPSYARAVFDSDAMVDQLVARGTVPDRATKVSRLAVIAEKDSILLSVHARAGAAADAARLADRTAAAYVAQLNKGGPDVGSFLVQGPAPVPSSAVNDGAPAAALAALGAVCGVALAIGLLVLLAVARRPLVLADDVASLVGTPVIGTVVLPRGHQPALSETPHVPGLVRTARALLPLTDASVMIVSMIEDAAARQRLLLLMGQVLSRFRTIFVSGPTDLRNAMIECLVSAPGREVGDATRPGLEFIDAIAPADVLEVPHWRLPVLLVIRNGMPRARLRLLVADNVDEEILGVVIVDERGGLRGRRTSLTGWLRSASSSAPTVPARAT